MMYNELDDGVVDKRVIQSVHRLRTYHLLHLEQAANNSHETLGRRKPIRSRTGVPEISENG